MTAAQQLMSTVLGSILHVLLSPLSVFQKPPLTFLPYLRLVASSSELVLYVASTVSTSGLFSVTRDDGICRDMPERFCYDSPLPCTTGMRGVWKLHEAVGLT